MSKLKEYAMGVNIRFFMDKTHCIETFDKIPIRYIVTFADNTAIEFFKKHGFVAVKPCKKGKWNQRIKISKQSIELEKEHVFQGDWHKFKDRIEIYKNATLMCYTFQNQDISREYKRVIAETLIKNPIERCPGVDKKNNSEQCSDKNELTPIKMNQLQDSKTNFHEFLDGKTTADQENTTDDQLNTLGFCTDEVVQVNTNEAEIESSDEKMFDCEGFS